MVERLLPYFITEEYVCPEIVLCELNESEGIRLNDFVGNEISHSIVEVPIRNNSFSIQNSSNPEEFKVKVFKIYSPGNYKSRISLVAHKREVSGSVLHKYIPEFIDEFVDTNKGEDKSTQRNYICKAYVFGNYLDTHVSLERGSFEFGHENDLIFGIGQAQIEIEAAKLAKDAIGSEITNRQENKQKRVQEYVDNNAPWHKDILASIKLEDFPYNATESDIESRLQKEKFKSEQRIRNSVERILADTNHENLKINVTTVVNQISDTSKNDLIHYVSLRRSILEIFEKSLQVDDDGKYTSEGVVHDIIFPRKGDSDSTSFHSHNLWIIDERLNFTSFVSSDKTLSSEEAGRPDLLVYNNRILFRGDNEATNPITIFEFKKPQRDDFANPSSKEDPIQQIIRYVNSIRDGKYRTIEGRQIQVAENTPFYGYVICDITPKVSDWLEREKNFSQMPDRLGWFDWKKNINLYMEVLSWDKVLKDSNIRNRIFFEHLGI